MTDWSYERVIVLIQQRRYADAEKELLRLLANDPYNPAAHHLLSVCKLEQGNVAEAEELIRSAIHSQPDNDLFLYQLARIQTHRHDYKAAMLTLQQAIAINPYDADYWGKMALIQIDMKDFAGALHSAEEGLEKEPDHITCMNARSMALIKLNRKQEAFAHLEDTLAEDPENAFTHANYGWAELEKGHHRNALVHFREALRFHPENEYAKAGLVQALKARYWFYRIFMKFNFWMSRLTKQQQWMMILGFFLVSRFLGPLAYLYLVFVLITWLMAPLSNLLLRLNPYGRYALDREETVSSNFVGISLLVCLLSLGVNIFVGKPWLTLLSFTGFAMMLPLSSLFAPSGKRSRTILAAYAVTMGLCGIAAMVHAYFSGNITNPFSIIFFILLIAHGWVVNAMVVR
jgi:tetratricopeptide (TPR) repeat protein